jgi:hypothetical protein
MGENEICVSMITNTILIESRKCPKQSEHPTNGWYSIGYDRIGMTECDKASGLMNAIIVAMELRNYYKR